MKLITLSFNFAYTGIFNCTGNPVTQVPLGLGSWGVPLGAQLVCARNQDRLGLALALEVEKLFGGWVPPTGIEWWPENKIFSLWRQGRSFEYHSFKIVLWIGKDYFSESIKFRFSHLNFKFLFLEFYTLGCVIVGTYNGALTVSRGQFLKLFIPTNLT